MLPCVLVLQSFLLQSAPLHQHRCYNSFIHSLVDGHLGCFQSRPLKIKLLQILMCKPLYGCMLLFLLTRDLRVEWLDHIVDAISYSTYSHLFLTYKKAQQFISFNQTT